MVFKNRTDLAMELYKPDIEGVIKDTTTHEGIEITHFEIKTKKAEKRIGKPIGKYVCIDAPDILYDTEVYDKVILKCSEVIREMLGDKKKVLVVGLGNRNITPDALGPEVVSRVLVSNHLKNQPSYDFFDKLGSVCAIAPGVLGTTGIKTATIIEGVVSKEKPDVLIAIDAYCANSIKRIMTTIQISDSGITPGGGVGNRQASITKENMGIPVIAIGIPTVVDAVTIAKDITEDISNEKIKKYGEDVLNFVVTPKEIDVIIDKGAKTIANSINLAVHPDLTIQEIESYVG